MNAQRVLITAGASGIGLALARRFAARGDSVAICDADGDSLGQVHKLRGQLVPGVSGAIMSLQVSGAQLKAMRLDGESMGQRSNISLVGLPAEGLPLELELAPPTGEARTLRLQVYLSVPGLPGRFRDVLQARPAEWVPAGRGDHSLIYPAPMDFDGLDLPVAPDIETKIEER